MNPQPVDLTPVAVVTAIASALFGQAIAEVVGPYVVIIIAAVGGAGVMVMQRSDESYLKTFVYFSAAVGMALMFTVPASYGLAMVWEPLKENWLYAPCAALLAYSADKWTGRILPWLGSKVNAAVDVWIEARRKV